MSTDSWKDIEELFTKTFGLKYAPVALRRARISDTEGTREKIRVCRSIIDASQGKRVVLGFKNNACFGASWHLGFRKIENPKIRDMVRKFVVEGEKLFCSYQALDTLLSQMEEVTYDPQVCFELMPLAASPARPELVLFVCNAEQACRLLTLITFSDGVMPKIKIGGPTCRMAIMYPLKTGEVNISFYDYTARKLCNLDPCLLVVSVPYERIGDIVKNIPVCSAGTARIEYPPEFREFLKKRLT